MLSEIIPLIAVILFMALALATDLKERKIPNWLTVSSAVLGLVYHLAFGGWAGLTLSLGGFATGFGLLLLLWLTGSGGGGDVKLMGAVGAWLGAFTTLIVFIGSAVAAMVCMVAVLIWSNSKISDPQSPDSSAAGAVAQSSVMKQTIPYAVPVTMTVWSIFLYQICMG